MSASRTPNPRLIAICHCLAFLLAALAVSLRAGAISAQDLLDGEFGNIDLGRGLVEAARIPTIRELRKLVAQPQIATVLMFRLYGDNNNQNLPIWSADGERLAFQRTSPGTDASQLLVFAALSDESPRLIQAESGSYDLMFRWSRNNTGSFTFARIDSKQQITQIEYSEDGQTIQPRTTAGHSLYPTLFERTDGVRWLAYDRGGQIFHQAWSGDQTEEHALARGTSPTWSRDGKLLLMARENPAASGPTSYQVVIRNVSNRSANEQVLASPAGLVLRSPTWSPNENWVACYVRDGGETAPWRINVWPVTEQAMPKTVAADVVVNPRFRSEGPSWERSSRRIWLFSHQHRREEYFPLVACDIETLKTTLVDYPRQCTTPFDVAINPVTPVPELALIAHRGPAQDVFVLLLNHF